MFDSIQTAMAYAGGETDAVRKCDPRLFDSDTGQGNRHDVSWAKMQLSLYVIENEAAIAAVPGAIRTTLAVWLSARGHGVLGLGFQVLCKIPRMRLSVDLSSTVDSRVRA